MAKKGSRRGQARPTARQKQSQRAAVDSTSKSSAPGVTNGDSAGSGGIHHAAHGRGLVNLGNTCFLNSIVQCLNVSAPFSDELIGLSKEGIGGIGTSLCSVFQGLRGKETTSSKSKSGGAISPKPLLTQLVSRFPWYRGGDQQDAHEFLRMLLGSLSDETTVAERKAAKADKEEAVRRQPGMPAGHCEQTIWENFRGHLGAAVLCWKCQRVSWQLDPFLDLSLTMPSQAQPSGVLGMSLAASNAVSETTGVSPENAVGDCADADAAAADADDSDDQDGQKLSKKERKRRRKQRAEAAAASTSSSAAPDGGRSAAAGSKLAEEAAKECIEAVVGAALEKVLALETARLVVRQLTEAQAAGTSMAGGSKPDPIASAADEAGADVPNSASAAAEATAASAEQDAAEVETFEVQLSRNSKGADTRWGFQWHIEKLSQGTLLVQSVIEDSVVDRWNLKRRSLGEPERVICPGDKLVAVNGCDKREKMQEALKEENSVTLVFCHLGKEALTATSTSSISAGSGRAAAKKKKEKAAADNEIEVKETEAERAKSREARRLAFLDGAAHCHKTLPEVVQEAFTAKKVEEKGNFELVDCLQILSSVEALQDDYAPTYRCEECSKVQDLRTYASRRVWLWPPLPRLLTVHLSRFRRRGVSARFDKSTDRVSLAANLDFSDFLLKEAQYNSLSSHLSSGSVSQPPPAVDSAACRYELYGVCVHQGTNMQSGHYVAYVNVGPSLEEEDWYGASDSHVWKSTRAEVLKVEAYVAFYRKEGVLKPSAKPQDEEEDDADGDGDGDVEAEDDAAESAQGD